MRSMSHWVGLACLISMIVLPYEFASGQSAKRVIRRSAHEQIYLPDSLGKMELMYKVDVRSSASYKLRTDEKAKPTTIVPDIVKTPTCNPLTGGRPWGTRLAFSIPDPGEYIVSRSVTSIAEGTKKSETTYDNWIVVVGWPHAFNPIKVDADYYPGENPTISFGMRELSDMQGYSYAVRRIENGKAVDAAVDTGSGATISLGNLIQNVDNVKAERQFEVRGYYHGRTFSYTAPGDTVVHETIWKFRVKRPILEVAALWTDRSNANDDELPKLDMFLNSGYNPRTFSFYYYGRKGKSLILTEAKITNLQIVANPGDFLKSYSNPEIGRTFTDVRIVPDEGFLQADAQGNAQRVELTISFNTQFETNKRFRYYALVY
jgi:hypothetical protein